MTARHPRDDLAAFALGALDRAEAVEVERHLDACERCRDELHWLAPAVDLLPSSVPQLEPPPRLRRGLMRTVRAEATGRGEAGGRYGPDG
jgi:anti-sigma factor ChrR (cupin superfamily)